MADAAPALSRTRAARLIQAQHVLVNDKPQDPDYRVSAGDHVVVAVVEAPSPLAPDSSPLGVLLETPDLVVLDKPPGVVMHP